MARGGARWAVGGVASAGVFKPGAEGFARSVGAVPLEVRARALLSRLTGSRGVYARVCGGARPAWVSGSRAASLPPPPSPCASAEGFLRVPYPVCVCGGGASPRPAPLPSPLPAGGLRRFPLDASPQPRVGGGQREALPPRIYRCLGVGPAPSPPPSPRGHPAPRLRCRSRPPPWTRSTCLS